MGAAIRLRDDFDGAMLRDLAKRSRDGAQSRRLIALAEVYDGRRRSEAARLAGVGLQIVRDWVLRFNAEGPAGLIDRKSLGPERKLTDEQRAALARQVESGPIPAIHGVVRWRRSDLAQWLWEEYGVSLDVTTVGRELRRLGFAKLSARPRHYAQNEFAAEAFKKTSPAR
jgi:transposase